MENKRVVPITRLNKWFSKDDFDLDVQMSRENLEGDGNFTVILYRVNRQLTQTDNVYGETTSSSSIRYLPPIELKVLPLLAKPENKSYNTNGSLRYLQDGQLTFQIYQAQLDELKVEISYGDYVAYSVSEVDLRYYSVVNSGDKFFENERTIMGYKGATRSIVCAPIDSNEFNSL